MVMFRSFMLLPVKATIGCVITVESCCEFSSLKDVIFCLLIATL